LVERRLDVAVEALRQRDGGKTPSPAELSLARCVDARLGHPADDGWTAHVQGWDKGGCARAGDALAGARALARDKHWPQVRDLLQKSQAGLAAYPYEAICAGLLLSDTQRRLGELQPAAQTWQQSAVLAARLAPRCSVPALWEQLAAQRPITTPWPAEVADRLAALLPQRLHELPKQSAFTPEILVWFAIGKARLDRSEAPQALAAFKRADSLGKLPEWDDFLALYQARALLAVEQAPAAIGVLNAVASRSAASPWRLSALALLGSVKLHEGHTQAALGFLRQAVEPSQADFFGRAEAEADLGIAYLSLGEEEPGLRWLRSAQERLQREGPIDMQLTCLDNEAAYLDRGGRAEQAGLVQSRIRDLQSRGGAVK
jgi:tetratricopeptide (TPR) repeat protein